MTSFQPPEPPTVEQPTPTSPQKSRQNDPWGIVLGIVGGVLLGTGLTFAILGAVGVFEEPTPPTLPPPPTLTIPPPSASPPTIGDQPTAADLAAAVIPSTVAVEVNSFILEGSGSGVVFGTDGHVVTNHHVVDGASSVAVVFSDGARFEAEIVGSDPLTDLAVLKVTRQDITSIALGNSDSLMIGERAIAVGNPLGLRGGPTVTSGIVSALNRSLQPQNSATLYGLVQTDAPIAPGSSGGALVDGAGRLIGITTAIAVSEVGPEGLGFAVPVDLVVGVVNDLIIAGEVRHALLGINGRTESASDGPAAFPVGVLVEDLASGSAYESAGGQVNDVIVAIDDHQVKTFEGLLARLRRMRAGQVADLRILRADGEAVLSVTLGRFEP